MTMLGLPPRKSLQSTLVCVIRPVCCGGLQVILPLSLTELALLALAVAVLFITVHACIDVTPVTTTVNVALSAKSTPRLQFRVCAPTAPVMVQPAVVVCQLT